MSVVVYRGHNHVVMCDGVRHTAVSWKQLEDQCACYCNDPEYLKSGFSDAVWKRHIGPKRQFVIVPKDATR